MIKQALVYFDMSSWYNVLTIMNYMDKRVEANERLEESTHKNEIKMNEFAMDGIFESMTRNEEDIFDWINDWSWDWC